MDPQLRTYSELIRLTTFEERFEYLKLDGIVGEETFGFDRYLNQVFYNSYEWRHLRKEIIIRDEACDMATPDCPIPGRVYIHHMNPVTRKDILERDPSILDPEFLVCVSRNTHNAIHFGSADILDQREPIIRKPNDTCPWK